MCNLFPCHGACGSSRIPLFLTGLLFCGALLLQAATPAGAVPLNWADVVWMDGAMTNAYTLSNGVEITITVARAPGTTGSFEFFSPREDCSGECTVPRLFGTTHNLAVVFNPNTASTTPILITLTFSEPVNDLSFEISDIDYSGPGTSGETHRMDRVRITSLDGTPTLSFKRPDLPIHTFTIDEKTATATAKCTGGQPNCHADDTAQAGSEAGTVIVDFGAQFVSEVTITYTEAGNGVNPSFRGIGLFGNTELTPVELMSFSVE